jgi:hypothetical protein
MAGLLPQRMLSLVLCARQRQCLLLLQRLAFTGAACIVPAWVVLVIVHLSTGRGRLTHRLQPVVGVWVAKGLVQLGVP